MRESNDIRENDIRGSDIWGNNSDSDVYTIRIQGHLDDRWVAWFDGLTILRGDNGDTLLTGRVLDQAALHGLLRKVRDLGMPLIAVTRLPPSQTGTGDGDGQESRS